MKAQNVIAADKQNPSALQTKTYEVLASILILFFVYTAASSYLNINSLHNFLRFFPLTGATPLFWKWALIIGEIAVAALLFIPATRLYGFIVSLLTFSIFLYMLFNTKGLPHDFGGIYNYLSYTQQIGVSFLLALLSLCGIVLKTVKPRFLNYSNTEVLNLKH